jgi:hypothetical protein
MYYIIEELRFEERELRPPQPKPHRVRCMAADNKKPAGIY